MTLPTVIEVRLAPDQLDELADAIADRIQARLGSESEPDRWMDSEEAAHHVGISVDALYKLTAGRKIPFSQDGPGAKLYFRRSDLDRRREENRA